MLSFMIDVKGSSCGSYRKIAMIDIAREHLARNYDVHNRMINKENKLAEFALSQAAQHAAVMTALLADL